MPQRPDDEWTTYSRATIHEINRGHLVEIDHETSTWACCEPHCDAGGVADEDDTDA